MGQEGYPHHLGMSISRKSDEVLIEDDLRSFLLTQYESDGITINEAHSIILQLKTLSNSDLYESNKTFLRMLSAVFHSNIALYKKRLWKVYCLKLAGKNKSKKQVSGLENAYVAKDNVEIGFGNIIPVWLLGFMY